MTAIFDKLAAARDLEAAGLKREEAEAVASAIREGQGELATMADLRGETGRLESRIDSLTGRIGTLQWVVGVHLAISLATLAAVIVMALRPQAGARA